MNNETVFLVNEEYDNRESYEDHIILDQTVAVTKTKKEAEEIVSYLYDKILSIEYDELGHRVIVSEEFDEEGDLEGILVRNLNGQYSRTSGMYSYWIEEFEYGKIKNV